MKQDEVIKDNDFLFMCTACGNQSLNFESEGGGYMGSEYTGWCEGDTTLIIGCKCGNKIEFVVD